MKKKEYEFKTKYNKEMRMAVVVLADDTHIIFHLDRHSLSIGYPKKKFNKIFKRQMQDRKKKYLFVEFSLIELKALSKGLDILSKEKVKK